MLGFTSVVGLAFADLTFLCDLCQAYVYAKFRILGYAYYVPVNVFSF